MRDILGRFKKGYKQTELAKMLNVDQSTISKALKTCRERKMYV
jgi:DNA-binding MarR family transcriptional regulator